MSDFDMLVRLYTAGYKSGHNDMVEGIYMDVYPENESTYLAEEVREWLKEQNKEEWDNSLIMRLKKAQKRIIALELEVLRLKKQITKMCIARNHQLTLNRKENA